MTSRHARPLSILLATDGSAKAKVAEDLVASIHWPAGTRIAALRVDELVRDDAELPPAAYLALHADIRREITSHLARVERQLSAPGRDVETLLVAGRPATAIVEQARARSADLVVLGSRGHGEVASAILGSVAAEVADHAPCPVLVARRPQLRGIVVADDASDGSVEAEQVLAAWGFARRLPMRVVSVVDVMPFFVGTSMGGAMIDAGSYQSILDDLVVLHRGYADAGAARLVAAGCAAKAEVRQGTPASELIDAAAGAKADLIVVGSRGRTGLERLLMGSVARNVLFRSPVSVLVVRQKVDVGRRAAPAPRRPAKGKTAAARKTVRRAGRVRTARRR